MVLPSTMETAMDKAGKAVALEAYKNVFANAGVFAGGLLWESHDADWDWVLGVNVRDRAANAIAFST